MADTNPANFANLPKEKVKEIASMGGKASHGGHGETESKSTNGSEGVDHLPASDTAGRNADGTFTKGSEAASEAGHKGGMHSHDNDGAKKVEDDAGRREDGTFTKGSEAAKEAGHKGGLAAHAN